MERLSPIVFLHRPSSPAVSSSSSSAPPPKLIIFGAWMEARDAHIAKYLTKYQELYPSAEILVIKSTGKHFTQPGKLAREIQPAVPALRAALGDTANDAEAKPRLLVHMCSNGGSFSVAELGRAYREQAEKERKGAWGGDATVLPAHVKIFDSSPGRFGFKRGVAAMTAGVKAWWQRAIAVPFFWLVYICFWLPGFLLRRPDMFDITWAAHNDRQGNNPRESRRTYIYSKSDALVDFRHVEGHSKEAEEKGFQVRRELFEGSAHVAHMRADPERYWRIVQETWEKAASV